MSEYPNWFCHYANRYFERHLAPLAGREGLRFLQIGAYTGDATLWLFEHILTSDDSTLTDVDTWQGSDEAEHAPIDFTDVERVYDERTSKLTATGQLTKYKGTSLTFFQTPPADPYDFIYIDGEHTAYGVLNDAIHAIPLLRVGGLLAFDDYKWKSGRGHPYDPGPAIDTIAHLYSGRLQMIEQDLQVWFRHTGAA
jgi:predicted O-methyltransferase YrrM